MVVRLRLRLESGESNVVAIALLNSGYEALRPEILLSLSCARELALYPPPQESEVVEYVLADGSTRRLVRVPRALRVYAVEEDRIVGPVEADAVVSEGAEEPLISDKLAGKLGVAVIDFAEGIWCFRDELGRRERRTY